MVFANTPTLAGLVTLDYASTTGISGTNSNFTNGTIGTLTLTNDLTVANGGTGASTLTGLLLGNGASAFTALTTSSGVFGAISDETGGTGVLVGSVSPALTGTMSFVNASGTSMGLTGNAWLTLASSTALTATRGYFTDATSTTSFFSALGTFTNMVVNTLATFLNVVVTGLLDVGGGVLEIPNGTAPTVDSIGELALDSTSNQLVLYGSEKKVIGNGNIYPAFTYATSTAWTGTTTIPLGTAFIAETWNAVQCFTNVGTISTRFGDGTNWTNVNNSSTTVGTTVLTTNNTFTANEKRYVEVGTPASSPTKISCTISKSLTSD